MLTFLKVMSLMDAPSPSYEQKKKNLDNAEL